METRRALLVDAFTTEPLAGKPVGVVPDADGLADDQLRAIASELTAGVSAVVQSTARADRRVRMVSPTGAVDPPGAVDGYPHALVAAHAHLVADGGLAVGSHTVETDAGVVSVEIDDDGTVWIGQAAPEVERVDLEYDWVADALGADPATLEDVGADLPLAVASTGRPFLVVPVNFIEAVGGLDPDPAALTDLLEAVDAAGVYAFTFDALETDSTLHGRCFEPGPGFGEDPVTASACGAVGAYLARVGAFDDDPTGDGVIGDVTNDGPSDDVTNDGGSSDAVTNGGGGFPEEVVCEQGHYVDRPGRVRVRWEAAIQVGGRAVTALDGEIRVPAADDDEIIEA